MKMLVTQQGRACPEPVVQRIEMPADMATNCCKEYYESEPYDDETHECELQGIEDYRQWLAKRVRELLGKARSWRQLYRQIHQPCWRAARWKSLT